MTIYTDQERLEAILNHFGLNDAGYDVEEAVREPADFLRKLLTERDNFRKMLELLEKNMKSRDMPMSKGIRRLQAKAIHEVLQGDMS